jgi:sugar transferase (PEP-CTERM system associated)
MARALAQSLPFEMAVLGLFEFALLFALTFAMLTSGGQHLLLNSTDLPHDGLILAAMLAMTIAGTAATIGLYRPDVCLDRRSFLLCGTIAALLAFPAILLVSACRTTLSGEHVAWLVRLLGIWLPCVILFRFAFSAFAARVPVIRRVLVVGDGARAASMRRRLTTTGHGLFEPVVATAMTSALEAPADSGRPWGARSRDVAPRRGGKPPARSPRASRIWGIVIAEEEAAPHTHDALLENKLRGMPVYSDMAFQEHHLGRIDLEAADVHWLLSAGGFGGGGAVSCAVKRLFDIAVGLALIVATLPLMLVTALAIRLDSAGPVFYRQERTGLRGKTFTLFKFRSMAADAEVAGKPQWAKLRDPRVTRAGAFIRASRIDELPQLFNVLRGEMSLIGPRPERPLFVEELEKVIRFYHHRAAVKPGLTGWAQVNYPYGASVEDAREKLAYDLYYVKNRGLLLDMLILLSTVRVILFREGAR